MYKTLMGFREQILGYTGRVLESVTSVIMSPIRNDRAERLRYQRAEALLAKDSLTNREIREVGDIGMSISSRNPHLSKLIVEGLYEVVIKRKYSLHP